MSGFLEAWDKRLFRHLMQRLLRVPFMIINELGFRHLDRTGGKLLFNLLPQRYKRWCERAIEDDRKWGYRGFTSLPKKSASRPSMDVFYGGHGVILRIHGIMPKYA